MAVDQTFFDLVVHPLELAADPVHLVDETDPRHPILGRLPPDGFALGLDPLDGRKHHHRPVQHPQRPLDLGREIDVARRIDEIDHQRTPVGIFPATSDRRRDDRDSPLALLVEIVGGGVPLVDIPHPVDLAGVIQDPLGGRRLARVDVRNDADIANRA